MNISSRTKNGVFIGTTCVLVLRYVLFDNTIVEEMLPILRNVVVTNLNELANNFFLIVRLYFL